MLEVNSQGITEAHEIVAAHEQFKNSTDKNAKKNAPSPEMVRSAVASIVLAEMERWPEEIQSLIGEKRPSHASFEKGVAYVIGAYMEIASNSLKEEIGRQVRSEEVKTAKVLGPLSQEISKLREAHRVSIGDALTSLESQRRRRLKEAKREIEREFQGKMDKVRTRPIPEELEGLTSQERNLKKKFEEYQASVREHAASLREKIKSIDDVKSNWNSKKRKARRLEMEAARVKSAS